MESAVSFAPLRPAGFVNFTGRAGQGLLFVGRGSLFFRGARRASLVQTNFLTYRPCISTLESCLAQGTFSDKLQGRRAGAAGESTAQTPAAALV